MNWRILLAEDNPADVYLIQRALRQHGVDFDMEVTDSGKLALTKLRQYTQGALVPELIVLDLNLPQHDGIELLQCVRRSPSIAQIPVVVLTSSDSPKDQMRSLANGASLYLRKPSNLEDFMMIGGVLKGLLTRTSQAVTCN